MLRAYNTRNGRSPNFGDYSIHWAPDIALPVTRISHHVMFFGPGFRLSELRAAKAPVDGPGTARLKEVVMTRSKFLRATTVFAVSWAAMPATGRSQSLTAPADTDATGGSLNAKIANIRHLVVIYQQNHSFDNLYGAW